MAILADRNLYRDIYIYVILFIPLSNLEEDQDDDGGNDEKHSDTKDDVGNHFGHSFFVVVQRISICSISERKIRLLAVQYDRGNGRVSTPFHKAL
jgi:hypothetical protein